MVELSAAAAVVLVAYWGSRNAVWGTATLGALIGLVIEIIRLGSDWTIIGKALVIGTFIGLAFEGLPRILLLRRTGGGRQVERAITPPYRLPKGSHEAERCEAFEEASPDPDVGFGRDIFHMKHKDDEA